MEPVVMLMGESSRLENRSEMSSCQQLIHHTIQPIVIASGKFETQVQILVNLFCHPESKAEQNLGSNTDSDLGTIFYYKFGKETQIKRLKGPCHEIFDLFFS
jgi:hypothetical protein